MTKELFHPFCLPFYSKVILIFVSNVLQMIESRNAEGNYDTNIKLKGEVGHLSDICIFCHFNLLRYVPFSCALLHCIALRHLPSVLLRNVLNGLLLFCIVLYGTVLYCNILHCNALHLIVLQCIALHCMVLYCTVLHPVELYFIVWYCIKLYCIALNCLPLYCILLH